MRRCGHVRHLLDEVHVLRLAAQEVVTDQRAERCTAERAEFLLVDLLEQRALVEVDGRLEVLDQVLLRRIEDLDLHVRASGGLLAQVMQAPPAAFQLLEGLGVHDRAELLGNDPVDLGDACVKGQVEVVGDHHGTVEDFLRQGGDDVLGAIMLGLGLGDLALLDDLVEQARLFGFDGLGGQLAGFS
ncbi:hypothetical protein G6F31_014776 [Rhizopus arrhizus]|nr:hypothetical protein G6F31_014776 [Rhizopus arrhizus]